MRPVRHTEGLERVRCLPRRDWREYPIPEVVQFMTSALAKRGAGCAMPLRPIQAVALAELHDFGGGFWPVQVGGGKTLISLLAPRVVDAKRPVLLVPASLRAKTIREAKTVYAQHYSLPTLSIQSYQTLSRDYDGWLEAKKPDLIVADECHFLKNTRAAVTKKLSRYLSKARKDGRQVRFVAMSGTAAGRSLRDFWHLIRWALGAGAPVPDKWEDMIEWGLALDSKVEDWSRLAPGPLLTLGPYDTQAPLVEQGRQAFGARLDATPGVIVARGDRPPAGLEIRARMLQLPRTLDEHFHRLRSTWETPDGHPFEDAMTLWRHARELASGFYYVWDPRPPEAWLDARRAWSTFVRETLSKSRTYDSPFQVVQAVDGGQLPDGGLLAAWRAVKDTFVPNSVPVWVDDTALAEAARWLERERGICWVEHRAFGQKLAERTGVPHFAEKGVDPKTGTVIDQHKGPAIAQIKPCSAGFNLQGHHHKNLIVSAEPTGKMYEQLLGRTHRPGQEKDTVFVEHLFGCHEQLAGFWQAHRDAHFAQQTPPSEQKLTYATIDVPELDQAPDGAAWSKSK